MSKLFNRVSLFVFLISILSNSAAKESVPGPKFEEVISLRGIQWLAISPNGHDIAYEVETTDWKNNEFDTEIWLSRRNNKPFQLTRTLDGSSTSPQWSPDGQWIGFLADRGNKKQIYLIRSNGGEAQAITDVKEGVKRFRWSPDGKQIAFLKLNKEKPQKEQKEKRYGQFSIEDKEYRNSHLWLIDVLVDRWPSPLEVPCDSENDSSKDTKRDKEHQNKEGDCLPLVKPKQLTKGSFSVRSFNWSPDGTRIAYEHRADPAINSYVTADISVLSLNTGKSKILIKNPAYDGSPFWSPDSKWIAFYSDAGNTKTDYYKNGRLNKVSARGGKAIRLAGNFDENISGAVWTGKGIFFLAWQKTKRQLFKIDDNTVDVQLVATKLDNIRAIDFSDDGETLAIMGRNDMSLYEIYRAQFAPYTPAAITNMSKQIKAWQLGNSEVISWKSKDGAKIEGVLHTPKNFKPKHKYPLLVVIHGGPTGISVPNPIAAYVYPISQWLAKGAVVLEPNYRGSTGYGEAFRSLNVRNLGVGDAWDVLSGVDHLIGKGFVDSQRMGVMGWSQGGYISAYLTTNSDRFKAVSVGAGISNWMTYYVNTDIHPFTRQYLQATPWEDPKIYAKTSPMSQINQAKTPTLIQHGELDKRVPIANAYELYQGLQDVGVDTKLIVYKGFGHGINKPKERLAAIWHNWQWFAKYIWNEDVDLPLPEENQKK